MNDNKNALQNVAAILSVIVVWLGLTYFNVFGTGLTLGVLGQSLGLLCYVHGWFMRLVVAGLCLLLPSFVLFLWRLSGLSEVGKAAHQIEEIADDVKAIREKEGA
jgi:hypothetical protein